MKLRKLTNWALGALLLANVACNTSGDEVVLPKGAYENGIIIANEGKFNVPQASVSFATQDLSTVENDVYNKNNNEVLGMQFQGMGFQGDNAYLILSNSNKIQVVNRWNFKKEATISNNLALPRYIAFANSYMYVTNSYPASVSVFKTSDNSFVKKINVSNAEHVVEAGSKIFVQNASFGTGKNITIINSTSNEVEKIITVPNGDINKIVSYQGSVYAIAKETTKSYIYQISTNGDFVRTITLEGIGNGNNLVIDQNKFYFTSVNKIYTMDMNSTSAPTTPILSVVDGGAYMTLYGFNVINGKIYTSDVKGFTADSEISVFDTTGKLLKTFTTGIGTNGFYLNK
ncbi:MAG: hypothetical protein KBA33_08025 [Cloacibacterium sp.]|jgi:hypothetical protein|nr:hypothetical protein [Cloacibacterium sp.]